MNADLNSRIQRKLNKNKKSKNMKRLLLVLSLVAVIVTSTVLANPASALAEDVSDEVVQGLENGGDSGSGAQAPVEAADEQANAQGNEAAPSSDPQETLAAPSADQGVMNANSISAVDSAAVTGNGTGDSGIVVSGAEADGTNKSADQISAAEGSGTAEQDATLAEAAETVSTEEAAAEKTTEQAEQAAQSETDVLSFADDRAQVRIARKDGSGFPSDTTMSGSPLGTDDWNRVLSAVSSKVKAQSDDSTAYSVAGLHTWKLSLQAGDGSAASYDDIRAEAEFQGGLNDAGYATKTSEKEENGTDGTSITTASYETSWRVYAISGDSIADPVEDHLTDLTNADGTSLSVDENGALQSAAFDGSLPETVVFAQIVRETVITGTEKKEEIPMPAVTFDKEVATDHGTIMVHVEADEGTFEQGTTMSVKQVSSEDILDKAIEAAGGRGSAAAVDISFRKADGTETEPAKPIRVKMTAKVLGQADKVHVVHVDDTGSTDVVARKSDGKTIESTSGEAASSDAKNAVSFKSDSFSVYAIVYTVDFTFSGYTYSIKGGSSIRLSSLAQKLGLRDTKQGKDFDIADVDDVTFSNSSLVEVTKKDGDWELVSKKPFTTTEKLTISMKDGSKYEVEVKDEQGVDLSKYIKSVDTYKYNNGRWDKTSSIQDGDNVKFQLNFSVNSGELSQGQKLTYKMDNHIAISKATFGTLHQETTPVGTVNVDTDGKVTISLNASFDSTKAFEGEVNFEGTVHNSDSSESITVNFGEEATISIQPKSTSNNYDVSTAKTGSYQTDSNGNHNIRYEVTISTTKGTGDAINFTDSMYANGIEVPQYDLEQVWVYKNGTTESVSVNPFINSEGKLEIDNLPELNANDNYHVIYCVPVNGEITSADGSASVNNSCHAWNNNVNGWGGTTTKIQDAVIQKTGFYDSNSGKLKWTITVNNPEHKNLSGAVLKDILSVTDGDGANVKLPKDFTIKDSDGKEFKGSFDADGSYKFPSGSYTADKYTIEYETTAPTGTAGTTSKVKNTITYQEGGKDYHTDSGDINVYHPTYGVYKWAPTSQGQTDAGEKLEWTARVDLPDGELDLTKLTYTDTMTTWNKTSEITGKHFITPALLNEASVWSDRGTLVAGTDYQLQKLDGSNITGNNSTEQLAGFRIQFFEAARIKLEGQKSFSLRYDTIADEQDQPAGSTWTYKNKAAIPDHESEASYDYKKPEGDLVKQVSLTDETSSYSSDAPQIEYSEKGMTLYYKVLIRLSKDSSGDQTIVDVLPSGMDFGKLNRVVYFDDIWNQYDDLNHYTGGSSFNLKDHVVVNSEQQADGTTKTTFTLSDGYERPNTDSYCIAFYYTATINDAQFWGDLHNTEKEYTNQAVWGNLNAGVTTKVRHTIKNLDKIAQLSDVEGKDGGVKKAAYYLTINPLGSDLVPTKDTITLKDQLSCDEADVQIQFKPESLKVFAYDGSKENHCGDEINQNRYGFSYNEQQHSMELKLPDETPCVVYYEYYVVPGMNKAGLSNSASLSGIANSSSDNTLSLSASTAAGSVSRDELTIYKVDSDNYRIKLQGVAFDLYQYQVDNSTPKWTKIKDSLTTDQDGKLYLNLIDDNLKQDCLYKLIETGVGGNTTYQFDKDKAYYFIWASKDDESKNDQQIWNAISGYDKSDAKQEEVNIIRHSGTIYVPNENTGITINKVWLNADHTDDKNPGEAEVTLYRQAKQPGGVKVTVNVKDPWNVYYQNEIYIKSGTPVSMLIDTDYEETYSVNGNTVQFHDGQDHTLELGSPSDDTTYTIVASYWNTQKVKELYYTPTDQYTNIGDQVKINTYTLSSENNYSVTVGNLPLKDDSGNKYYYWVEERKVPQYTTSYSDNNGKIQKGTITVTNTRESVTVSGSKAWKNADGSSDPPAGASCVFELYKNGTATGNKITLDGTVDDREKPAWTAVFSNLDKYDASGTPIPYTVREVQSPAGYAPDKTEIESGGTITNSQEQQLEFTKIWSDGSTNIEWPSGTTIKVTLHGKLIDVQNHVLTTQEATYELDSNSVKKKSPESAPKCTPLVKDVTNMYMYQISGLPSAGSVTTNGKAISGNWHYYITEEKVSGYQDPKYVALNGNGTIMSGNKLNYVENGQAIINQKDSSYTLPSTGGHGTLPLTGAGALLLLLAGTALTVRKLLIQRNTGKGDGSE